MKPLLILGLIFWIALILLGMMNEQNRATGLAVNTPRYDSLAMPSQTVSDDHAREIWNSAVSLFASCAQWQVEIVSKAMNGAPREIQAAIGLALVLREVLIFIGALMFKAFGRMLNRLGG
jgi:hypothetical protein